VSDTICAHCANLFIPEGMTKHWRAWLCVRMPQIETNFVTGELKAPYVECFKVNGHGCCKGYEPGPNVLHPREGNA
jgi:hypothetical protein